MRQFFKRTIVGGVLFLLPVVLATIVLGHALQMAKTGIEPISRGLGLDKLGTFAGVGATLALSIVLLVAVSFFAGLIALTSHGRRFTHWLEQNLLGGNSQYKAAKTLVDSIARVNDQSGLRPVLVDRDGEWHLGYQVEQLEHGWWTVFLPRAPNPASGSIILCPGHRLRPLDLSMSQVNSIVQKIGVGSSVLLKDVDLRPRVPAMTAGD